MSRSKRRRRRRRGVPGVSLTFSRNRALGITSAKQRIARTTGIPTTRAGRQRKIGAMVSTPRGLLRIGLIIVVLAALLSRAF